MQIRSCLVFALLSFLIYNQSSAQDSLATCKVEIKELTGAYTGDCKNGLANGKGEAKGMHRYTGQFKKGFPYGNGTYYYNENEYYTGNFQNGVREGKGEMHYIKDGKDSVIKGYWSGNEYRGKTYKTYSIIDMPFYDRVDIQPSDGPGNTITVITTATIELFGVREIIATDGSFIRKVNTFTGNFMSTTIYELSKFPVRLMIIFSDGKQTQLELFKTANWEMRLFQNK